MLRRQILRWYGHVKGKDEDRVLKNAVEGRLKGGDQLKRPKKTWKQCVEEDMRRIFREERVYDFQEWERLIAFPSL